MSTSSLIRRNRMHRNSRKSKYMYILLLLAFINVACGNGTSITPDSHIQTYNAKPLFRQINLASKIEETDKGNRLHIFKNPYDSLPLFFRITDSIGKPVEGIVCTLSVGSRKIARISDDFGEVLFWVPPPRLFQKVELKVHSQKPLDFTTDFTSSSEENLREGFETGEGMLELRDDGIKLLYEVGYKEKAHEVINTLRQEKQMIHILTGLQLKHLKVFLTTNNYRFGVGGWIVSPTSGDLYNMKFRTLPHEWVEQSLGEYYGVYDDPNTRWIGDGVANYIAFEIDEKLFPESTRFSRIVYEDSSEVYDLRTWGKATLRDWQGGKVGYRGYDLAPYFWAKVMDKSGDSLIIAKFFEEFRHSDDKSSENAIAILESLSGLDINKELVITGKEYLQNVYDYWVVILPQEGMEFIPGGSFAMGDSSIRGCSPVREVKIDPFYLDVFEVTNKQFCRFLNEMGNQKEGGSYWFDETSYPDILFDIEDSIYNVRKGRENYPVYWVSWYGARAYAEWIGKRLPTEAEWEYAASNAGQHTYPWGNEWHDDYCNWAEEGKLDGSEFTAPVGSFEKGMNHFGCYDMVGNVFEWVNDWYAPYNPQDMINPQGYTSEGSNLKVHRGGCYKYEKEWQNRFARIGGEPAATFPCVGFRCAKDVGGIE
ncbi:SUMF1/EgtB/PvdO family nonheme iron enzyme, partial [candidate division WOR-3 bacterium]|nr:SUMF1/EgtB/PvdO family nonheme iron enzyme [candidate division WOR-3 bacterium]